MAPSQARPASCRVPTPRPLTALLAAALLLATGQPGSAASVTFATFTPAAAGPSIYFEGGPFPGTATLAAVAPVSFRFLVEGPPAGPQEAVLYLYATTTAAAQQFPVGGQLLDWQLFNGPSNELYIIRVSDGANLLSARFAGALVGFDGGSTANLSAATTSVGEIVEFTSDFLDFSGTLDAGLLLLLAAVNPPLALNGPSGASFLRTFSADGLGAFTADWGARAAAGGMLSRRQAGCAAPRFRSTRALPPACHSPARSLQREQETHALRPPQESRFMQGHPDIIEVLNRALTVELTAINQYFCQAKMCKNWGYNKLAAKHYEESMGEMKHAEKLIDRILFLEGVPEIARYDVIRVGTTVKEQFENDLALETKGVRHYNDVIELCLKLKDNGTRDLVDPILTESEEHVDWLETQLHLIEAVGLQNYLTEQMGTAEAQA